MWQEDIGSLKNPKKSRLPREKSFNRAVKICGCCIKLMGVGVYLQTKGGGGGTQGFRHRES
jgi:hypothetical protein